MKATKIYYKRLFNLGNYNNAEIGIELQLEENESAEKAIKLAKIFIEKMDPNNPVKDRIEYLENVINNPREYNYGIVKDAEKELKELKNEETDDLPF